VVHGRAVSSGSAEDKPGQRVMLATSVDFLGGWEAAVLVDSVSDADGERVLAAAGFHADELNGTLVAYFGNYGPEKQGTQLMVVTTTDGVSWSEPRKMGVPVNHPPERSSSGRLIISGNISFPYTDDSSGLGGWSMGGIYPTGMPDLQDDPISFHEVARAQGWDCDLCEGSWYETDDGLLHMLLRNTAPRGAVAWCGPGDVSGNPSAQR
jgi:hypothetical protein